MKRNEGTSNVTRRSFVSIAAGAALAAGCALCGRGKNAMGSEEPAETPHVFFSSSVTPESLQAVFDATGFVPAGKVAVKISTGETGSNYLRPELVGAFIQGLNATITECNTAYGGQRSSSQSHIELAREHGFFDVADVDIMDEDGQMSLPVTGGTHLTEDLVGDHFARYDSWVSLAHFKGHTMGGFGGAIKNCSIGIASANGKMLIHSAGKQSDGIIWSTPQDEFLESMAEAAKAVADELDGRIVYVNVMNRISVDCDCDTHPAEPDMADIGILASLDPVALDQACVDLVYAARDGASVVERIESRNGIHTLEHAEKIGLGSRAYQLVEVDAAKPAASTSSTLVVCFSATGNTRAVAQTLAEAIGADYCEVEAGRPYSADDLNYNDSTTRATVEQNEGTPRPEIASEIPNWDAYTTVLLGHPIWWGKAPRIICTLLEQSADALAGKQIADFCTSGSSGIEPATEELKTLAPKAAWGAGRRFEAGATAADVTGWVESLDFAKDAE